MRKQEMDHILARMLDAYNNVSDLNITVGKPFQVETSGQLTSVDIDPPFRELSPFQSEIFALNLINQDRRLTETLLSEGSCDASYELPGKARFRVNIFSQLSNYSIVLRKLESKIPTIKEMELPMPFTKWPRKERHRVRHRRHRQVNRRPWRRF
jgi:twitching motility protein PilT